MILSDTVGIQNITTFGCFPDVFQLFYVGNRKKVAVNSRRFIVNRKNIFVNSRRIIVNRKNIIVNSRRFIVNRKYVIVDSRHKKVLMS
jgi:hypothetical protein